MKKIYTNQPIPEDIREALQAKLACGHLHELKGAAFTKALHHINDEIDRVYHKGYRRFFTEQSGHFIAKSLQRYFAGHNIRSDKLAALKCFLGYLPAELEEKAMAGKKKTAGSAFDSLQGVWYSYVYDAGQEGHKVKKTSLYLSRRNENFLDVQYHGLSGRFTGTGEIINNTVLFSIKNKDASIKIFLCAELPVDESAEEADHPTILNTYCLSNSLPGQPVVSNVIMIKEPRLDLAGKEDQIQQFLDIKPETLVFDPAAENRNDNTIIEYLYRNKARNSRLNKFIPNSFENMERRNTFSFKKDNYDNYDRLKVKLKKHVFFAFNRSRLGRDEVAVFSYTFKFVEEERRCIAYRHPIGNPGKIEFSGEAFLENEKICMLLSDKSTMLRHKQFVAPVHSWYNARSGIFVFRGITSTVSSQTAAPIALRELVVGIPDHDPILQKNTLIPDDDKTNGYISYAAFSVLPEEVLPVEEKLFLANPLLSVLTFPARTDNTFTYYRQNKARKYTGVYYVFTLPAAAGMEPLKMELDIDTLSQATLKIRYGADGFVYTYEGIAEFYNPNLRVSVHFNSDYPNERHAELIFDPIREKRQTIPEIITGINLTTDDENRALALAFMAISKKKFMEGLPDNDSEVIGIASPMDMRRLSVCLQEAGLDWDALQRFL